MNMDFIKNILIAGMVVGTVLACRAILKAEEIVQQKADILNSIYTINEQLH